MNCSSSLIQGNWFGVNPQPIIIKVDNDLYPNNQNELITFNNSSSSKNRLVLSDFTLPTVIGDFVIGQTYKLTYNGLLYTVIDIDLINSLVIFDSAFPLGLSLTGTIKLEYKRYKNTFLTYTGLPISHQYYGLNPLKRLGDINVIPNSQNESYLDISPLLRNNFEYDDDYSNKPLYNNFFNDVDLYNEVNITINEYYEVIDDVILNGDEKALNPFYVLNGSIKPTEGNYTQYLIKPIESYPNETNGIKQKFLTIFNDLYVFKNKPFTINFLLTNNPIDYFGGIHLNILIDDSFVITQIKQQIPHEIGYGYIRYIFDLNRLYTISGESFDLATIKSFTVQLIGDIDGTPVILSELKKGFILNKSFNEASSFNSSNSGSNCVGGSTVTDTSNNTNDLNGLKDVFLSFYSPLGTWEYINFNALGEVSIEIEDGDVVRNNIYRNNKPYQNQIISKKIVKKTKIRTSQLDKSLAYNILDSLMSSIRVFKYNSILSCEKELVLIEGGDITITGKDKNFAVELDFINSVESLTQRL